MNFACEMPQRWVGRCWEGQRRDRLLLSQSQCVRRGCGTFQRRLGGVCAAGQASGFRHRRSGPEAHSQRDHRGVASGPCGVGHQNCVCHSLSVFFDFFFKMTLKSHAFTHTAHRKSNTINIYILRVCSPVMRCTQPHMSH